MEGEITKGELCIAGIITLFHEYASKDGDKDHLSKSEVKQLLKKEFPNFTGEVNSKEVADQLMASLDINGDEKVDFQEFVKQDTVAMMWIADQNRSGFRSRPSTDRSPEGSSFRLPHVIFVAVF
ncbi:hypothetical protein INR49_006250 [Caranx melampygus]|nr:hypothetical protein INR49_006250 [Caranx melampygus]